MGTSIDGHKPFWLPAFVFVLINSAAAAATAVSSSFTYHSALWTSTKRQKTAKV